MIEEEARTKWCPFPRVALVEGMSANRTVAMPDVNRRNIHGGYADITEETRCIGSSYMMWKYTRRRGSQEGEIHVMKDEGTCGLKHDAR